MNFNFNWPSFIFVSKIIISNNFLQFSQVYPLNQNHKSGIFVFKSTQINSPHDIKNSLLEPGIIHRAC